MARVALQSLADGVIVNATNQLVVGANVHVYTTGTTTPIPIYSDATSATLLTQPLVTDSAGRVPGYADGQQTVDFSVTIGSDTFGPYQAEIVRGDQTPSLDGTGRLLLGQMATHAVTHHAGGSDPITPASIGAATVGDAQAALQAENNLSDVASVSAARSNLGLGTVATHPLGDLLQSASLLSDLSDIEAARYNLQVPVLHAAQTVATTNVTALSGLLTIDGYTLVDGDRVLLTGQSTASQNGPWVAHSGGWARPNDYPSGGTLRSRLIAVNGGATHPSSVWQLASTASVTIDSSNTSWTPISGTGGGGGAVSSVFGRTGAVAAQHGDYSYKHRSVHTFAIQGALATAASTSDSSYIPPFFISVGANETVQLVKVRGVIGGGTSVNCTLQRNGTNVTGFTNMATTTIASSTTPTAVSLAEDDQINLVLSSLAGSPSNLSLTVVLEHTIT